MIKRGKWGELRVEVGREGDDGVGEVGEVGEGGRSPVMVVVVRRARPRDTLREEGRGGAVNEIKG